MGGDFAARAGEPPPAQDGCVLLCGQPQGGAQTHRGGRDSSCARRCGGSVGRLSCRLCTGGYCARPLPLSGRRHYLRRTLHGCAGCDAHGGEPRQPFRRIAFGKYRGEGTRRAHGGRLYRACRISRAGCRRAGCASRRAARDDGDVARDGRCGLRAGSRRRVCARLGRICRCCAVKVGARP